MNQMPSFPGSGSIWFNVTPVHAMKAGRLQTVEPTAENVKLVVPLTLYWR
jgi:hypothetical protein